MKVTAFNGSPRPDGNTSILIREVLGVLEKHGIETEIVQVGGQIVRGCCSCRGCFEVKGCQCTQNDDPVNEWIAKMRASDGIILGSPTYVTDVTAEMKALIDRTCLVAKANPGMLRRKAGAAVVAVRRAGAIHAFDTMNHFFGILEMVTVGSCYWNLGIGLEPGDVRKDNEGLNTMHVLGENMAWLIKKIAG